MSERANTPGWPAGGMGDAMAHQPNINDSMIGQPLPSAYRVVQAADTRYYPMRFGKFRLDARGYRISFGRREDAEAFCHNEQAHYVTAYPSVADR